ncbi:MAG: FKBP-type peptidyl-prolyl cis-trans isomerase [Candidatus Saliniplasma sp.]
MKKITTFLTVIIVIGASVGGVYALDRYYFKEDDSVEEPEVVVEEGDQVTVHYIGWLEDERIYDSRRVFDSTREVDQGTILTYAERERGEPFQFTVDEEQVIDGWVENVKGMSEGETKTFTIPPEKAYTAWSEDLILEIDRVETLPVYEEMNKDTFEDEYGEEPKTNMVVKDRFWNWDKVVTSVEGDIVTLMHDPELGGTYRTYIGDSRDWTTTVTSLDSSEDEIVVHHDVNKPSLVDAQYISLHKENFEEVINKKEEIGQRPDGTGIVVDVSEETITIDFNEEVNNKALTFRMEVLEIQKGEGSPEIDT